jgi:hypothetical protein
MIVYPKKKKKEEGRIYRLQVKENMITATEKHD